MREIFALPKPSKQINRLRYVIVCAYGADIFSVIDGIRKMDFLKIINAALQARQWVDINQWINVKRPPFYGRRIHAFNLT